MKQPIRSASSKKMGAQYGASNVSLTFSKLIPITVGSIKLNPAQTSASANNVTIKYAKADSVALSSTYYLSFGGNSGVITLKPPIDGTLTIAKIKDNYNGNYSDYSSITLYDISGSEQYIVQDAFSAIRVTSAMAREVTTSTSVPLSLRELIHDPNDVSSGYLYKLTLTRTLSRVPTIPASTNAISYTLNMDYFNNFLIYYNNTNASISMPSTFVTQFSNYFGLALSSIILKKGEAILVP